MDHVGDTTRDNASSTKAQTLIGYIEDGLIRTEDKCRSGRTSDAWFLKQSGAGTQIVLPLVAVTGPPCGHAGSGATDRK